MKYARLCLYLASVTFALPAVSTTFVVDTTSNTALSGCTAAPDDCSLRGAILASNAGGAGNVIEFDIPATDAGFQSATAHWRINASTELPFVTRNVVFDGYTQPGAVANTLTPDQGGTNAALKIEIRGLGQSGSLGGIYVANGDAQVTVRGLAINNFVRNIIFNTPGPQRVEGCFIGTDITGNSGVFVNGLSTGINVRGGEVTIGGSAPAARNVISGNSYIGIWGETAQGLLRVEGNLIGTNAAGTAVIPGQDYGLYLDAMPLGVVIGGTTSEARNLVSGNEFGGIYRFLSSNIPNVVPVRIEGNWFGTDVSGTVALPNGIPPGAGARFPSIVAFGGGTCGMSVGGVAPGAGNLIAFSGGPGVQIASCRNAPVLGNTFFENRELPIDVSLSSGSDGPTPNDPGDVDASGTGSQVIGGNRLQNTVEILSVVEQPGNDQLRITLRIDSAPSSAAYPLRIDVYRDDALGTYPISVHEYPLASAQQLIEIVLPLTASGTRLAFSATDADGNTSELLRIGDLFDDGFEGQ